MSFNSNHMRFPDTRQTIKGGGDIYPITSVSTYTFVPIVLLGKCRFKITDLDQVGLTSLR